MERLFSGSGIADFARCFFVFLFGGFCYGAIEILCRGHTHPTMVVLGGICFLIIYLCEGKLSGTVPVLARGLIYALIITVLEFISGIILNLWLGLGIWDYSGHLLNFYGQICILFSFFWYLLSLFSCLVCRALRIMFYG